MSEVTRERVQASELANIMRETADMLDAGSFNPDQLSEELEQHLDRVEGMLQGAKWLGFDR